MTLPPLPTFKVQVSRPQIGPWIAGNTGVRGFTSFDSGRAGPHVVLLSLMHGNEICGAIVLDRLLRDGLRPKRGRLSFGFANLAAYERFDPLRPTNSRFVDEDMNRVWDPEVLDGKRHSIELSRAREMRPLIDTADIVLDLHSMLWPSEPLTLCGATMKGRKLATAIGWPRLVVADDGHMNGRRLIDYPRFADPHTPHTACLVEAGQHWEAQTADMMLSAVWGLLRFLDLTDSPPLPPPPASAQPIRVAVVTQAVTAMTSTFTFAENYRGGDVVPRRNTLIATDGGIEIRTPHDRCLLVMPALRPSRGHTAVRLGKFEE